MLVDLLENIGRFIAIVGCSVLWALGGYDRKEWRRFGVPLLLGILSLPFTSWYLSIVMALCVWAITTIGYGMPCVGDNGSPLGKFFTWVFKDEVQATFATRLVCGVLYGLALVPIASRLGDAIGCVSIVVLNTLLWTFVVKKDLGGCTSDFEAQLFPPLNNEELFVGLGIGLGWSLLI